LHVRFILRDLDLDLTVAGLVTSLWLNPQNPRIKRFYDVPRTAQSTHS